MKLIKEMQQVLHELGLKKRFDPHCEPETDTLLIRTRKPAQIINGELHGSEIALCGSEFKIWTSQKQKAKARAIKYGLKVRLLDGEAELIVPAALADKLLPEFGAKVKRDFSPEQLSLARLRMQHARNNLNFKKKSICKAVSDPLPVSPASLPLNEGSQPQDPRFLREFF